MSNNTRLKRINEVKKPKLKIAKPIVEYEWFCGQKWQDMNEKALSVDPEHKPYVRGARSFPNLPDGWDDTKWIDVKRYRTWKCKSRNKKQFMKVKAGPIGWVRNFKDKIIEILGEDIYYNYTDTFLFKNLNDLIK